VDRKQSTPAPIGGVERFRPTSGRFTGAVLVVAGLAVGALSLIEPSTVIPEVGAGGLVAAVLGWTAMLRPRVSVVEDDLELRNMLETVNIPLAAVEEMAVRQVLAVQAGEKRFTSPALGRKRKSLVRGQTVDEAPSGGSAHVPGTYPEFVEERIRKRVAEARARVGVRPGSAEQLALAVGVRRAPAWPEIVALAASAVVLVVAFLL